MFELRKVRKFFFKCVSVSFNLSSSQVAKILLCKILVTCSLSLRINYSYNVFVR